MSLEDELRIYFGEDERHVVLIGVGNPMRADDGIGPKIIELLENKPLRNVMLLNTETVPEAFTGKVESFNPTHVLLIDAANFGSFPGDTRLITSSEIGGQAVSTHSLPLTIFISYIERSVEVPVLLLGVQPKTISFYDEMSEEIASTAEVVAETLSRLLSD